MVFESCHTDTNSIIPLGETLSDVMNGTVGVGQTVGVVLAVNDRQSCGVL